MKEKIVSYTWDTLPLITPEREAELKALAALPDSEIDFSDIPEWTAEDFKRAKRGLFYRRLHPESAVRIDADILEWLKKDDAGADARANAILRREMLAESERKAS